MFPILVVALSCATADARPQTEQVVAKSQPSLEHLRKRIATRDGEFKNLSASASYHNHRQMVKQFRAPYVDKDREVTFTVDTSKGTGFETGDVDLPAVVEIQETPNADAVDLLPKGQKWVSRKETNTPGKTEGSRRLGTGIERATKKARPVGTISPSARIEWWLHPSEALGLNMFSPSTVLSLPMTVARVAGVEHLSGYDVVRIDWHYDVSQPNVRAKRGAFWVAPRLDDAVVRSVLERRPSDDAPWREIHRVESEGYTRVDGHWLPQRAKLISHNYWDNGEYEEYETVTVTFDKWSVNRPITDKTFHLDFPDGTLVTDQVRHSSYVKGRINN